MKSELRAAWYAYSGLHTSERSRSHFRVTGNVESSGDADKSLANPERPAIGRRPLRQCQTPAGSEPFAADWRQFVVDDREQEGEDAFAADPVIKQRLDIGSRPPRAAAGRADVDMRGEEAQKSIGVDLHETRCGVGAGRDRLLSRRVKVLKHPQTLFRDLEGRRLEVTFERP